MRPVELDKMRRSSSKLITRARSVRNMGKVPFRFTFEFKIESVEKLVASGDIVVVWERSQKNVESTSPARIDRATRKASFNMEAIKNEITLFKTSPSEKKFQDKSTKLAVRANGVDGKTLGKIHINLADYAEVPSGSKRISAELTNGAVIIAQVQSLFISMGGKSGKGVLPKSENSSGDDTVDDNDLGLLDTEDVPANFLKNKLKMGRAASKKFISSKRNKDEDNHLEQIQRLKRENERLKKLNATVNANASAGGELAEENKKLKLEVQDLQAQLAREPVYSDVVKELKEAKMGLAFLHLEKEKLVLELSKYQRGEKQAPKRKGQ